MTKEEAEQAVMLVFHELDQRSGFDGWWDGIDKDVQVEVIAACVCRLMEGK